MVTGRPGAAGDDAPVSTGGEIALRRGRLAFMALVTAAMLALTFEQALRGPAALGAAAVYALTVGFGLEFVRAEWPAVRGDRVRSREH